MLPQTQLKTQPKTAVRGLSCKWQLTFDTPYGQATPLKIDPVKTASIAATEPLSGKQR